MIEKWVIDILNSAKQFGVYNQYPEISTLEIHEQWNKNKTFQDNASKLFNSLPIHIRNCKDFNIFTKLTKDFLIEQK